MTTDWMLSEVHKQRLSLEGTLWRTKGSLESRMRVAVRVMIRDYYPIKVDLAKNVKSREYLEKNLQMADLIGDALFGLGTGEQSRTNISNAESVRRRPIRILNYIEKLVELVPADYLIMFLSDCLSLGLEETIGTYEVIKGEAKSNDYFNLPTGIDSASFRKYAW